MLNTAKTVIPHIINQHAEEASFLWLLRNNAVNAPHYDLNDLAKLDDRVEAHLDGLRIAGDYGWQVCHNNLQLKESGEVFTAAVLALEGSFVEHINQVYEVVEQVPETIEGLISAFGWVEKEKLQGKVNGLYGKPINIDQCNWVLKNGTQRLRYQAAILLVLMKPEQALFEVRGRAITKPGK